MTTTRRLHGIPSRIHTDGSIDGRLGHNKRRSNIYLSGLMNA
ncbi:hypothetical protein HID58_048481 [Brassica napus]|uniref:Uncharacterized protein n=1 Tax=Brassica napus TaxID=3708 RepID=A0ABQ8B389_BRANA|nr:hypothetical protein HID58_048481 [Brassica napus]